jgi:hypothetical protein
MTATNGLRPVEVADELFLLDTADQPAGRRATALLARCLGEAFEGGDVRSLTIGEREALLLRLRAASVGEELAGVVPCAEASCRTPLEFRVPVADLLLAPYDDPAAEHRLPAEHGELVFRLPTVGDLQDAVADVPDDPMLTRRRMIERCVAGSAELSDADVERVADAMAELDPQAELVLELDCTECGQEFDFVLDIGAFLVEELDARAADLVWEVHTLASRYHWSEADILAMTSARRRTYLDLLDRSGPGPTEPTGLGLDELSMVST